MLHSRDLDVEEPENVSDSVDGTDANVTMADRSSPRWAVVLGASFGLARYACTIGIIVLALLFHSIVVEGGESRMAFVLFGVGMCLIAGIALLEFAHSKSLRGFRWLREKTALRLMALLAIPAGLIVLFVHPLAGLTIPACAGLGWFLQWRLSLAKSIEAPWVYLPQEAVSLLAGRDGNGVAQATMISPNHALSVPLRHVMVWTSVLLSLAVGSYLISELILTAGVVLPMVLLSGLSVSDILKFTETLYSRENEDLGKDTQVIRTAGSISLPGTGLLASKLNVRTNDEQPLLTDITMSVEPGEVVGIIGESGAGKSLLMQSLVDPFSLAGVQVSGRVTVNGVDLWQRSSGQQSPPAIFVADTPVIIPVSGADNLSCFQGDEHLARGQFYLEQMVFAHDLVQEICLTPDASLLPSMQRKALALSRGFALSPSVYFLDRPEDALQAAQISALCNRVDQEIRLGRSIVLISDNRALLDKCDRLFVLQNGTLVDFGPAAQVRERRASGWHRFISRRSLDAEVNLEKWVRSHFRRDGDETNRRRASHIASELLAVSCREASHDSDETVEFLFKNFEGYCVIQMIDSSAPISSVQIQKAQELVANKPLESRRNPLVTILGNCLDVEFESHLDGRMIKAKVETYDPRKTKAKSGKVDAQSEK